MHILPHFQHSRPLTIAQFLSLHYEEMFLILFRYKQLHNFCLFITKKSFLYYSDIMCIIYPWFLKRVKKVDSGIKKVTVCQEISWI